MTATKGPKPLGPKRAGPATRNNTTAGGFCISDELWEALTQPISHVSTLVDSVVAGLVFLTASVLMASATRCAPAHEIRQPRDGVGVVGEVEDELLPSADAPQIGVVSVAPPAPAVGVVGQRRLVAVGVEPPR